MAKSFSKGKTAMFNDDSIKEALKSGLKSIHASEELLGKTLVKCRDEIARNQRTNKGLNFAFMPLLYKVGAPLAAGALVVVLTLNIVNLTKHQNTAAAPEAVKNEAMLSARGTADGVAFDKAVEPSASMAAAEVPSATPAPEEQALKIQFSEATTAEEPPAPAPDENPADGEPVESTAEMLDGFNSSVNRTNNDLAEGEAESLEVFKAVVNQFNTAKGQELGLYEDGVIRVQTLKKTGFDIQNLMKIKSYRDLLSGEGYWALPLVDSSNEIKTLLVVNLIDKSDPALTISNRDIIVNVKDKDYLISAYPDFDNSTQGLLFDAGKLNKIVKEKGYQEIKEISAVDVNYGFDFLIFVEADNRELVVPVLRDAAAVGLINNSVYTREELMRAMSLFLSQTKTK